MRKFGTALVLSVIIEFLVPGALSAESGGVDQRFVQALIRASESQGFADLEKILSEKMPAENATEEGFPELSGRLSRPREALSSSESALVDLYGTFREFRIKGNPNSVWFKDRLRDRLADAVQANSQKDLVVCAPGAGPVDKKAVDGMFEAGQSVLKSSASKIDFAAWKKGWNPKKAISFVRMLEETKAYISETEFHIVTRSESQLVAPRFQGNAAEEEAHRFHRTVTRIVLHHSDTPEDRSIKDIQAEHMKRVSDSGERWSDIGYHYLTGLKQGVVVNGVQDWRIFEGRHFTYRGSHATGMNNADSFGIEIAGNYHPFDAKLNPNGPTDPSLVPPPEALLQTASLIYYLSDPNSKLRKQMEAEGVKVDLQRIDGHRDCKSTICPGDGLYAVGQEWNRQLQLRRLERERLIAQKSKIRPSRVSDEIKKKKESKQ